MTATANEDAGRYTVCQDKERLYEAAARIAAKYNFIAEINEDRKGRIYISPFVMMPSAEHTTEVFTEQVNEMITEFFAIYDSLEGVA